MKDVLLICVLQSDKVALIWLLPWRSTYCPKWRSCITSCLLHVHSTQTGTCETFVRFCLSASQQELLLTVCQEFDPMPEWHDTAQPLIQGIS